MPLARSLVRSAALVRSLARSATLRFVTLAPLTRSLTRVKVSPYERVTQLKCVIRQIRTTVWCVGGAAMAQWAPFGITFNFMPSFRNEGVHCAPKSFLINSSRFKDQKTSNNKTIFFSKFQCKCVHDHPGFCRRHFRSKNKVPVARKHLEIA